MVPMPSLALRVSNVVSYVVLVAFNVLSSLGAFGPSNADVSRQWRTPLTPAGWAFSIWGVIFGLQGAAVLYAAVPAGYHHAWKRAAVNAVGYGWQLTWLAECAWLALFPRTTAASFVLCAALLFAALAAVVAPLRRLYTLVAPTATAAASDGVLTSPAAYVLYVLPSSLNTAWLSVASCLGVALLAASQGASDSAQVALAATLALAVSAAGAAVVLTAGDVAYGLTIVWALSAVRSEQSHVPAVRLLSTLAAAGVAACCVVVAVRQLQLGRRWGGSSSGRGEAAGTEALLPPGGD